MTKIFCFTCIYLMLSPTVFAESDLSDVRVSREEINQSLDMLQKQGSFSAEDIKRAREALGKMDNRAIDGLNSKAQNVIKNDPEAAKQMAKSIGQ